MTQICFHTYVLEAKLRKKKFFDYVAQLGSRLRGQQVARFEARLEPSQPAVEHSEGMINRNSSLERILLNGNFCHL